MTPEQQKQLDSLIGKRVIVIGDHPHEGETGTIKKFYPVVGITGKPGFEIDGDNGESFFIFSNKEIKYL